MGILDELDEPALIEILTKPGMPFSSSISGCSSMRTCGCTSPRKPPAPWPARLGPQGGRTRPADDPGRADARPDVSPALEQARARHGDHQGHGGAARSVAVSAGKGRLQVSRIITSELAVAAVAEDRTRRVLAIAQVHCLGFRGFELHRGRPLPRWLPSQKGWLALRPQAAPE